MFYQTRGLRIAPDAAALLAEHAGTDLNKIAIADSLVEISLAFVKAMLQNGITHHIHIIRFIAHQQINRLEDAVLCIFHNLPAERISIYKTFCHKNANIVFSRE